VFQREPGHVAPKNYREFSAAERNRLCRLPVIQRYRRFRDFMKFERRKAASTLGTAAQRKFQKMCIDHIEARVRDPALRKFLTPTYAFFCKRAIIDDFFYPTLNRDNVELVPRAVTRVTKTGLVDADGVEREIDVLVMATGFHAAGYLPFLDVKGRGNRRIHDVWKTEPRALMGLSVPGFPNFFMLYGPNTNSGGSMIFQHECQAKWIVDTMHQMRKRKATAVEAKQELFERFNRWIDKGNSRKAWVSGGCNHNYFLSPAGRVVTQWPYSSFLFWVSTRAIRPFAYVYQRLPAKHMRGQSPDHDGRRVAQQA
jgi:cation diffusion facilitator CzcD-associated flavoprotein CzcO